MYTKASIARRKKSLLVLLIGLLLVGLVVCVLFAFRFQTLRQRVHRETERYLQEISLRIAETVDSRMDASFRALRTTALIYPTLAEGEGNEYLKTVAREYGFRRISITRQGGSLVTTDGLKLPTDGLYGVKAALEEGKEAANLIVSPFDGEKVMLYDVPIWQNGNIVAALSAATDIDTLREYLGIESFGGEGFSGIINSAGDVVTTTQNRHAVIRDENFFDLVAQGSVVDGYSTQKMQEDLAARETGLLEYTLRDNVRKILCYVPLHTSDWYVLSVVPYSVANQGADSYIGISEGVDMVIILLFLALIAVLAFTYRSGQREIARLAFVDSVTGGANRTAFEQNASALIAAAPAGGYVLVSLDLQGFKLINETFGSEAGNLVLTHVHRTLQGLLEEGELVGRIDGDIFNLLLKWDGKKSMERRMELMAERINHFNLDQSEKYYLPLFQGIYTIEDPGIDIITAQDRANVARKSNKRTRLGRLNTAAFYDDLYRDQMRREKEIDNRMEAALANGEFVIYLQPKVELRWNSVVGAEALVRWNDPARGLVPPGEFIPLFEQNGFIITLDRYVLEQVCILQRRWLDEGRRPMVVSVNLSRSGLADPGFLEEYVRLKEKYRIPDGLLELEITETLFVENTEMMLAIMERIQQAGFLCSLDDFGSGYSTLSLLRQMPADTIKLDRVFFDMDERNQRGEYVVQSILELARRLKIHTVCEGVEHPFQLHCLQRYQCDMVQGFVFSPAVPPAEFEQLAFSGTPLVPRELVSR